MKKFSVLLAGGSGTRLWPVSRELYPKQLVKFIGNNSLIQNTIHRLTPVLDAENVKVVCGVEHYHEIARHMEDIGICPDGKIISEPIGKNTAPAILLAILDILSIEEDAIICVFPADHVIEDTGQFHDRLNTAILLAQNGYIVTFGIEPHYPETGYGYIEGYENLSHGALSLKRFVEKPDRETAISYLEKGTFFWNSGMFAFKASVMLKEFEMHQRELLFMLASIFRKGRSIEKDQYAKVKNISIDCAIMEKTNRGAVLPSSFGWSDIGSWKSLYDFLPKNGHGNVLEGDIIARRTHNCFILGRERLITANDIKNMVIVETPDAIFISDLETSRDVKSIVEDLRDRGRNEHIHHPTIHYEWGKKTRLENTNEYEVARIVIYPNRSVETDTHDSGLGMFSLVKGMASLTVSGEVRQMVTGDQAIVRSGEKGFLKNGGEDLAILVYTRLLKN